MQEPQEDGVYSLGDRQYLIVQDGISYNTENSEFLGCLPVFGGTIELFKDSESGYFTLAFSSDTDKTPTFTQMHETTAKLWQKGTEKYWASKQQQNGKGE